ncbi:MAG: prepilin-type N-terminal cleavage/methylation domain-containing protein [Verrucomicrobiales bacterium]|nr:prepilin-type N-terminal cleavage/methylation domain-containing protein [Verrucomicrobiales bacterium]
MTSPTSNSPAKSAISRSPAAFTLLELILVMALLVIGFGAALPTLRRFFGGRALDSEARRLQSLARYGQNRAVTEGVPMVLWFDPTARRYGLQMAAGYAADLDEDTRALEFEIEDTLEIRITEPPVSRVFGTLSSLSTPGTATLTARRSTLDQRPLTGLPAIRLLPDGYLDARSPDSIELRRGETEALWLVQTTNRLAYELRTERPVLRATY